MRWWWLLVCVGCGSDKGGDTAPAGPATFTEVYDTTLKPTCALGTCHLPLNDGAVEGGMVVYPDDPDRTYDELIGGSGALGKVYVVPGDVDGSFLVNKITGNLGADELDPMPDGTPLDAQRTARIVEWIERGAPND